MHTFFALLSMVVLVVVANVNQQHDYSCKVPHAPNGTVGETQSAIIMNDVRNGVPESTVLLSVKPDLARGVILAKVHATALDPQEVGAVCFSVADVEQANSQMKCSEPLKSYTAHFSKVFAM